MLPSMAALTIGTIPEPPAKTPSMTPPANPPANILLDGFHEVQFTGSHSLDDLLMLLKACGVTNMSYLQWCTPAILFGLMQTHGLVVCKADAILTTKMESLEPFSVNDNLKQVESRDPLQVKSFEDKMRVHNSMFACLQVLKYPYLFVAAFDDTSPTANYDGSVMNIKMTPSKIDYFSKLKTVWNALVMTNGMLLKYAAKSKWERPQWEEVVLRAVKQNFQALQYAGSELLADNKFLHKALHENGAVFLMFSEAQQLSPELLLYAARHIHTSPPSQPQLFSNLRFIYDAGKSDHDMVKLFLDDVAQEFGFNNKITNYVIKECNPVLLACLQRGDLPPIVYRPDQSDGKLFGALNPGLTKNKEFVLELVKKDGTNLQYASDELMRDEHVVLVATNQTARAILSMAPDLQDDKNFLKELLKPDGTRLYYFENKWKRDRDVVTAAVNQNGMALQYARGLLNRDRGLVLAAVNQNGNALRAASETLKGDLDVVTAAVTQDGNALGYASAKMQCNYDVVLAAVNQNGQALEWACSDLRWSDVLVTAAVTQDGMSLQYAHKDLKNNIDVVTAAVTQNLDALKHASDELQGDPTIKYLCNGEFTDCMESRDQIPQSPPSDPLCPHTRW
jgi:hypothetical protein